MTSLYVRLGISLLVLTVALAVSILWISLSISDTYSQEVTQRLNQNISMYVTEQEQLIKNGVVDQQAVEELANRAMTINPTVEVYVLDARGEILSHVVDPDGLTTTTVPLEPLQRFLGGQDQLPITGLDPRSGDTERVFSVSPILDDNQRVGYLYAVLGGKKYQSLNALVRESYILKMGTAAILGSVLVALIAGIFIFFVLTRRLAGLRNLVEAFRVEDPEGDFGKAPDTVQDEIDELHQSFVEMATHIQKQYRALQSVDATRRELIANVSHDLRTPLASMQGYLETLLIKEDELSREERYHYLKTALKHSVRLNGLIAELFELAKLDSGAMEVNFETFSLTELVYDCVQEFELQAKNKRIEIEVRNNQANCHVNADIAMIQRVLQNLVDNAIQHTPEGKSITLTVSDSGSRAMVEVSDTGQGIASHEVPHIFDRFYYAKQEEPSEKIGSGLGLAIVKKILDLHESTIRVKSQLNEGTCFTFDLPAQPA